MFRNRGTAMEDLGELAMHAILLRLSSTDVASLSCVNTKLRVSASDDDIWSKFCADELDLTSPVDHLGNSIPTFKETYQRWKEDFSMYPWPLVVRGKRCWDRIKNWFSANFPEAFATLRKGASEDDIANLENQLNVKLPLPTRLLYRFCDGQQLTKDGDGYFLEKWLGLIGGYVLFNRALNILLFSVQDVIDGTKNLLRNNNYHNKSKYILVASSSTQCRKYFVLDCDNGQLFVGSRNIEGSCKMIPCVPKSSINSMHECDGMLAWLEEHYRRLQTGTIRLRMEGTNMYLCQFSEEPPFCTTAVTNGVKIRASAILVPEHCHLQRNPQEYWFAYSIRLSLLPNGCFVNGRHFRSCELQKRSWNIVANNAVIINNHGETDLGMYPLLSSGEAEYVYQSGIPLSTASGAMGGSFTFVPGSSAIPEGAPFEVKVAPFPLAFDYIY